MEINLNSGNINANWGVGREAATPASGIRQPAADIRPSAFGVRPSSPAPLQSGEPVAEVPDAELVRDDALGRLVSSAFCLPPPPMPSFP